MKLRRVTVMLGDKALIIQSSQMKNEQQVSTPIDYDPITERVIQHISDTEKQILHLDKVLMYTYEEEKSLIQ